MIISKAKTFTNVLYATSTKGATLICVFVSSSIIARNLTPSDYGVVGFAAIIIGFLFHFSDMGVGTAVIRSPEINERKLATAFTLKLILGSAAFIAALLVAPFAHHFFEHPQTGNVIRLLSLNFLLSSIGFLSVTTLTREMNYRALMVPGMIAAIVRCALVVVLIFHGWRYWAIIAADVGTTFVSGVVLVCVRRVPIRLRLNRADAQEYLRFGIPLFGTGVLVFLIFNLDNFLVGAKMGSAKLGYYALAFTWASFICGLLYDTVHNVLVPTLAAIQNDVVALRRWYLKTVDLAGLVAVVANTALLANAHQFLVTFLGKGSDKWLPAQTCLQILCVYGIIRALTEPLGPCLLARGETKMLLKAAVSAGIVELVLLISAVHTGRIALVAAVVLAAYVTQAFVYIPYLRKGLAVGIRDLVAQLWPMAPAIAAGYLLTLLLPDTLGATFFTLAIRGLFTATVVLITHGLLTRFRCVQEATGMIYQNLARVAG